MIYSNVACTSIHRVCDAVHPHFEVNAVNMPSGKEVGFVTQNNFGCRMSLF